MLKQYPQTKTPQKQIGQQQNKQIPVKAVCEVDLIDLYCLRLVGWEALKNHFHPADNQPPSSVGHIAF